MGTAMWDDSGNGDYEGRDVYWHKRDDGRLDVFPGGVPSSGTSHDHIVLEGADVSSWGLGYKITGGRVIYKRVNGFEEVSAPFGLRI